MSTDTLPRREAPRTFDECGRPLREVTFTVLDLETTGASAAAGSTITEVGAVKVRGGEVLGEFQTLVDPESVIPLQIQELTGITSSMVLGAPRIGEVIPSFLEFAAGTVLVAHNAPFDLGFLQHFAALHQREWPEFEVIDTVRLARRVITPDDAPDCKLSSLARLFSAGTTPNHRALADARATVDVLHGLMERVGGLGVQTLEELLSFSAQVSTRQRRKRHLAEGLPHAPGVYLFKDDADEVLHVGHSADLHARVRSYFTETRSRSRVGEMVARTTSVTVVECATSLEAQVRASQVVAEHRPRSRRRARRRGPYFVQLTREDPPRLALVRRVLAEGADYVGPFDSRPQAVQARETLDQIFPTTLSLAEARLRRAMSADPGEVVAAFEGVPATRSSTDRRGAGGSEHDGLPTPLRDTLLRALGRRQRVDALSAVAELVAIRREEAGHWAAHVIRHGRLAAAGVIPPGADAHRFLAELRAEAERGGDWGPTDPFTGLEESERVLAWLEQPGIRLTSVRGDWICPIQGAGRYLEATSATDRTEPAVSAP